VQLCGHLGRWIGDEVTNHISSFLRVKFFKGLWCSKILLMELENDERNAAPEEPERQLEAEPEAESESKSESEQILNEDSLDEDEDDDDEDEDDDDEDEDDDDDWEEGGEEEDGDDDDDNDEEEEKKPDVPVRLQRRGRRYLQTLGTGTTFKGKEFARILKTEGLGLDAIKIILSSTKRFLAFKEKYQDKFPKWDGLNHQVIVIRSSLITFRLDLIQIC
jgi:hypothetical protein